MSEQITRTFIQTKAQVSKAVFKNNAPALEALKEIVIDGKADEATIVKATQKREGNKLMPVIVTKLEYIETLYSMDVEYFKAHAKIVPPKEKSETSSTSTTPEGESK